MAPEVGDTLTASATPADALVTYQWNANGEAISGATEKTLKVTTEDIGKKFSVTVTGIDNYKGTKTSEMTAAVPALTLSGKYSFAKESAPTDGIAFEFSSSVNIITSIEINDKTLDAANYKLNTDKTPLP